MHKIVIKKALEVFMFLFFWLWFYQSMLLSKDYKWYTAAIMINKINPSIKLKSLDTTSLDPNNHNAIKVPKVLVPTNKII